MVTLHIEHAISDLEAWLRAFEGFAERRRGAGVRAERVARPIDDPHFILIDLDFGTTEEARRFLGFLETVVWAVPENSPALVGAPRTLVLEPVPTTGSTRA